MDITERIAEIEKKLDTVLHILGHGREKSDAQIQREAEATALRIRSEKRRGKAA